MRASFELEAGTSLDDLSRIGDFILETVGRSGLDQRGIFHLMMAADEACTNIIKYSGSDEIKIRCDLEDDRVVVEIRDRGFAFNPLGAPAPKVDLPLQEREVGGLGIHFIRTLADGAEYRREGEENVLTLTIRHRIGGAGADP
ncbi:MAG: ATP-binding protein [Methanothrix sp.]|jgi:serine/threonine-protein kinase RsbW|nr:ATP-binding protein [Methanothrix sp.]OPX80128.1 MAG: serine-protein kinase RsbW [Methanosaeta sp. PtaB.Bin087]OPY56425.1 MAG: serine-protein kinase RsbW [Methanosaeta sp. PtaU1.Bin055]NLX40158.1 ATP-binding protein [Methanothrix sp.]HNR58947.1 ATP-binding protein [Methanothrix sp.]